MKSTTRNIQHLFLRAGFSENPSTVKQQLNLSIEQIVDRLFQSSNTSTDLNYLPDPLHGRDEEVSSVKVLLMILKSKKQLRELNLAWLDKMVSSREQLREKMTFFWHNHFATSVPFAYLMQVQNNTLRKHALGKFSDLLHAVAKDPAMIIYLNNQQNKKNAPNENFAREVMELFTLGIGNYTEHDIREAARAFTGWTVNLKGKFEFVKGDHDFGEKEFMGRKGNFSGEDILNILLDNPQVAEFVVTKIYREFVNDIVDEQRVNKLAEEFLNSGYDISALMRKIFTSEWFFYPENIGVKIASPVELIVRYRKLLAFEFKRKKYMLSAQDLLGQVLFFPPNVSGWKGGQQWIDSSTLLLRMNLPQYALLGASPDLRPKQEFDNESVEEEVEEKKIKITTDWSALINECSGKNGWEIDEILLQSLLQCDTKDIDINLLHNHTDSFTDERRVISFSTAIMSLPEFQLI